MIKAIAVMAAAMTLTGCVSTKNTRADVDALRAATYRSVTVATREKPSFAAMTAGKAQFGLLGAAAMISAGNQIVRENEVPDPAVEIARQLAVALSEQLGAQVVANGGKVTKATKPQQLAAVYAGADLLVDIQTVNWSFAYFPTDWNNYRVIYSAKLRLIDTRSRTLLAEGFCSSMPERTADSPSRDQLLADKAARLKAELDQATAKCVPELAALVLGSSARPAAGSAAR